MPTYSINGTVTLTDDRTAYIILREEPKDHMYGVAVKRTGHLADLYNSAPYLSRFVRTWHRSVQGAMDEANALRV